MKLSHRGFQVSQYRPWKLWLAMLGMVALCYLFFALGRGYQNYDLSQLQQAYEVLLNQMNDLKVRNKALVDKNAKLSGNSKIEHEAYQLANKALSQSEQELLALKQDLVFYQGIVSPKKALPGVKLQSFEIMPKSLPNHYGYKLVLTQSGKTTRNIKGKFDIMFQGKEGDVSKTLKLTDIKIAHKSAPNGFSFRYFQVFEGEIRLPGQFIPYEVEVHIQPSVKQLKPLTESISWASVLSEDS